MARILVIEDDARLRASLELDLADAGHQVRTSPSAEDAQRVLESEVPPDLLLVDVRLEGRSGVELVEELQAEGRLPTTVVMSGEATIGETVAALRLGVVDFLEKPFHRERLLQSIDLALELAGLRERVQDLDETLEGTLLGDSPPMVELREQIRLAASSPARVLVTGESGSGKELVAEGLHRHSDRADRPFVRLNCAAIPPQLIEAELFGHAAGAFTDARSSRPGLFEVADGGVLFLDEVGDMELTLQSRLLRVLEDGRVRRVGETRERRVDVRVVSATHRRLGDDEAFRQDLFYRLAELRIEVPPLRERGKDIELLFDRFLDRACREQRSRRRTVTPALRKALRAHAWPGNVRELKNVCRHLAVFGGESLTPSDLPSTLRSPGNRSADPPILRIDELRPDLTLREFKKASEREFLEATLRRSDWNVSRAARRLEIQRTHLHERMKILGIERPTGPREG